jgi:hypothetical protein
MESDYRQSEEEEEEEEDEEEEEEEFETRSIRSKSEFPMELSKNTTSYF